MEPKHEVQSIQAPMQVSEVVPASGLRATNRIDELYSPEYFGGLSQLATAAAKSKLFGDLTPDQLFIVLMTGREMGLPPTVALRNIGSFKGKTVISSQLQMAKVKEAGYEVEILENTHIQATVSVGRPGKKAYVKTFTMEDAKLAGLGERNALYKTNPATMLLNRAIGLACRYGAPEVLNGLYNETELAELDEPNPQPVQNLRAATVTGSTTSPMAQTVANGWTIEAQEEFADLSDRLYTAYKTAGSLDKHPADAEKWRKRFNAEPADAVLPAMQTWVDRLETAAKAKTQPIEAEVVEPTRDGTTENPAA